MRCVLPSGPRPFQQLVYLASVIPTRSSPAACR
jgi:hypothetical protein